MNVRSTSAWVVALALVSTPASAEPKPDVTTPDRSAPVRVRSPGQSAARPKVAVAPIVFVGSEVAKEDIAAELRAGIGQSAVDLVEPSTQGTECGDACWAEVARKLGVTHIVEPSITVDDKIYEVHIVARDARMNRVLAEVRETCEVCGVAEVVELARRQSAALGQRIAKLAPVPGRVDLTSTPSGATITVDDARVGRTPVKIELDAGPHRLRATLAGHPPQSHDVVTVGGVVEAWSFDFQPLPPPPRETRMRTAGWAVLGIGSAVVVPGIVFLALDGRPYRARCSGGDVDGEGDCRKIYDGVTYGAVFTAVGLALVATGIGLVVAARRSARQRARANSDLARR